MKRDPHLSIAGPPLIMLAALALSLLQACPVRAQEESVADMLAEATQLAAEKEQNDKEITIALEEMQDSARKVAEIAPKREKLEKQAAKNESDAAALISRYGGSMSGRYVHCSKKGGKTIQACETKRLAINSRISQTNSQLQALQTSGQTVRGSSDKIKKLSQRNREIEKRLGFLRGRIAQIRAAAKINECTKLGTDEASSQCLMHEIEQARSHTELGDVGDAVRPAASMRQRTAEEAIEDYKASGKARAQYRRNFRTRALPPPSPGSGK